MITPTLAREQELWAGGSQSVVGVDEVGVGPLCAAVVAAAVLLPPSLDPACLDGVRDSKTIPSREARERLAERIRSTAVRVSVAAASPREIELLNVRGAAALAMRRALSRIGPYDHAIIDGPLNRALASKQHLFLVHGDAHCLSIACASIIAKVTRDRLMRLLAARYPGYGWDHNVGYATSDHLAALRRLGPTPHHRRLYRPVVQAMLPFDLTPGAMEEQPC